MTYDLAIIGGGPAGLMAGNRASELGAKVILIEKNERLGTKLLLTGHGRCNLTNKIDDHKILADRYGRNGKFLLSGFSKFDADDAIAFFNKHGVATKMEDGNRILTKSDRASDILNALTKDLKNNQVEIKLNSTVKNIIATNKKITKIILSNGEEIISKKYLIATGGKSYPLTGSTGDAYAWLKKLGHTIVKPEPALTPIILQEKFISSLEGTSVRAIKLMLEENNKIITEETGDLIFTKNGISGPATINLSLAIAGKIKNNTRKIAIDFLPLRIEKELELDFQKLWQQSNKTIKNYLATIVPPKLADLILKLTKINPAKQANSITRAERKLIISLLKKFTVTIVKLSDYNQAMITAGGVKLNEVDPKTMRSKIIENLYLAGEVLDLAGPTGGFNLQICWTTGFIAGENAT